MYCSRLRPFRCRHFSCARNRQARAACAATVSDIRRDVVNGQQSAVDVVKHYLGLINDREERLGSFLLVDEEGALKQAADIDARVQAGEPVGPLAGVPIAVKDNICTAHLGTTAGSRILEGFEPPYDATAVARLRAAGAVIVGKTNCDEFGMGSTTENSAYKVTRNAWSSDHVPGGSSGGSASAVAGGQVPVSLGSDTGGSVRLPAHFNGCVGLKPTYGRVSRHGLLAYASSLDCIGPLTRSVYDAATVLSAIAGADGLDSTAVQSQAPDYTAKLRPLDELPSKPLEGVRIGLIEDTMGPGVTGSVRDAVSAAAAHLEGLGATLGNVSMPSFAAGLPAYYVIATSEASSNLARYDGVRYGKRVDAPELREMYKRSRGQGLGAEVKRRILMGTYALSAGYYDAYYKKAQQVRTLIRQDFDKALGQYDVLLSPVGPSPAYRIGEKTSDPVEMYAADIMTVNLNMAGLPALCLNAAFATSEGLHLPIGVQLIGPALGEEALFEVAHAFQLTCDAANTYPTY